MKQTLLSAGDMSHPDSQKVLPTDRTSGVNSAATGTGAINGVLSGSNSANSDATSEIKGAAISKDGVVDTVQSKIKGSGKMQIPRKQM